MGLYDEEMEGQEALTEEEEDLDSNEWNQEKDEQVTISKKEWKEMTEKLDKTTKLLQESSKEGQAHSWMDKIREDRYEFIKLYNVDKKMADYVSKKFWETRSISEVIRDLKAEQREEKGEANDKKSVSVEDVDMIIQEREAKQALKMLTKEYKLDAKSNTDLKDAIMEEYEDLIDGKDMTAENVEKYFRKAVRMVKKLDDKETKLSLIEQELQSAWAIGNIKSGDWKKKSGYFDQFEAQGNHKTRYK